MSRQLRQCKGLIDVFGVGDADVATRTRLGGHKLPVSEEVNLGRATAKNEIGISLAENLAVKLQVPIEGRRARPYPPNLGVTICTGPSRPDFISGGISV